MVFLAHGIVAEYYNIEKQLLTSSAYSPYSEIIFYRTQKKKEIPIVATSHYTIESQNPWIRVIPVANKQSNTLTIELVEPNTQEQARIGTIHIIANNKILQKISVIQNGNPKNFRIEAENFVRMQGVQTEQTSDEGGGMNVGWIHNDDFIVYSIDIPQSGTYTLKYRVASYDNIGKLCLQYNSIPYSTIEINPTGGWQNWITISDTAYFNQGVYEFTAYAVKGGFNLNYIDFTFISSENISNSK